MAITITPCTTTDTFAHTKNTCTNYKQAAWDEFREKTKPRFQELSNTAIISEQVLSNTIIQFNNIINDADKAHILKGNIKHYNPKYTSEMKDLYVRETTCVTHLHHTHKSQQNAFTHLTLKLTHCSWKNKQSKKC